MVISIEPMMALMLEYTVDFFYYDSLSVLNDMTWNNPGKVLCACKACPQQAISL